LDDLHAAIAPFVVRPGWFVYQEKVSEKVMPEYLVSHKVFLRSLTHICKNMSFSKSQLEKVFQRLVVEKQFSELATNELQEDWVEGNCKRVRTACRHLAQARLRRPTPRWLAHIDVGDSIPDSMSQLSSFAGDDGHPDEHGEGEEEEEKERDDEEDKDARAQGSHQDAQDPDSEQDAQGPGAEVSLPTADSNTCSANG
jgi:hypothetical protein